MPTSKLGLPVADRDQRPFTIDGVPVDDWGDFGRHLPRVLRRRPGKTTPPRQDPVVTAGTLTTITGDHTAEGPDLADRA